MLFSVVKCHFSLLGDRDDQGFKAFLKDKMVQPKCGEEIEEKTENNK